jgi:hypothetical protein
MTALQMPLLPLAISLPMLALNKGGYVTLFPFAQDKKLFL